MKAVLKVDIVIIGAGFAGLSTAHHLAKKNAQNILIIEAEKRLGGHASGRNAGMIRQALSDPVLTELAKTGCDALRGADKGRFSGFEFKPVGSLLLAKGKKTSELDKTRKVLRDQGLASFNLSKASCENRVPLLRNADFEKGLFCPTDASVSIEKLLNWFIKSLKAKKIPIVFSCKLDSIERVDGRFKITAGKRTFFCNKIVNAAGAWAGIIGEKAGATQIPFKAYRRHLFLTQNSTRVDPSWPFVWDISHNLYFRPKSGALLISPCDKKLFKLNARRPKTTAENLDGAMRQLLFKKLSRFSKRFDFIKIKEGKAGLRTMVPDGRFVIGEDANVPGFFWVAGLGGHGVTTSFSSGRLAADIVSGRQKENYLTKALSPKRFIRHREPAKGRRGDLVLKNEIASSSATPRNDK